MEPRDTPRVSDFLVGREPFDLAKRIKEEMEKLDAYQENEIRTMREENAHMRDTIREDDAREKRRLKQQRKRARRRARKRSG